MLLMWVWGRGEEPKVSCGQSNNNTKRYTYSGPIKLNGAPHPQTDKKGTLSRSMKLQ